jgi:hypothetical protein
MPTETKIQSGKITASLKFKDNLIPEGTAFWFKASKIKNPPSTLPIEVKSVKVLDKVDSLVI